MVDDCTPTCQPACPTVFDRVRVFVHVKSATRVEWTLDPNFQDPGPYVAQLQTGRAGVTDADAWTDVGLPVTDTYYAVDDEQRVFGKTQWTHYRVQLTTGLGVYYSQPTPCTGDLDHQDWRRAREILRMELLRMRKSPAGVSGYLLKRRLYGTQCDCLDFQTDDVSKPDHERCFGTGIVGGYFAAIGCTYADLSERVRRESIDGNSRGTINDIVISGRMLAVPSLDSYDVWVDKDLDVRYYIHTIKNVAEVRRVPVVVQAELRPAAYSDVIYSFPLPE